MKFYLCKYIPPRPDFLAHDDDRRKDLMGLALISTGFSGR